MTRHRIGSRDADDRVAWVHDAIDRYERPLVQYAMRITGDLESARDIAQETFLKLWSADRERVDGHVAEWLYTVCRNRALDVARKERRMTRLTDGTMDARSAGDLRGRDATPSEPAPDANAQSPEERSALSSALQNLPDRQREILRLKFQAGLSYKEIAGVMGLSVSNVGFLIHTSIKALRESMHVQPG
ncbi:MAG: RNA polymerase sigma factor [Phycisphaerales bacterium]